MQCLPSHCQHHPILTLILPSAVLRNLRSLSRCPHCLLLLSDAPYPPSSPSSQPARLVTLLITLFRTSLPSRGDKRLTASRGRSAFGAALRLRPVPPGPSPPQPLVTAVPPGPPLPLPRSITRSSQPHVTSPLRPRHCVCKVSTAASPPRLMPLAIFAVSQPIAFPPCSDRGGP